MINVEIIKVRAGQILPCGQVTGNKEFTVGSLIYKSVQLCIKFVGASECLFQSCHACSYIMG